VAAELHVVVSEDQQLNEEHLISRVRSWVNSIPLLRFDTILMPLPTVSPGVPELPTAGSNRIPVEVEGECLGTERLLNAPGNLPSQVER